MQRALAVGFLLMGATVMATPVSWEALARQVLADLQAGHYQAVESRFDDKMKAALSVEKLQATWVSVEAQVGKLKSCGAARENEQSGYHRVELPCSFERAQLDFKLAFAPDQRIGGMLITPAQPAASAPPPYAVSVDEVKVSVKGLPGILTLPKGAGPFPTVVLVHGSGPHDADETIGPQKPFRDLALGLAAKGIATLRYEKRTHKEGALFTVERKYTVKDETIDDARAAVEVAQANPRVDGKRVVVLGHSLGGYVAPRIADGDAHVAAIVIMAGSVRPLEDLVIEQTRYLAPDDKQLQAQADASARAIKDPKLEGGTTVDLLGAKLPGSYFLDLRKYDAAATAAKLAIPILVLQGERDYQVRRADYDLWARALAGHKNATLKLYPTLNHLFQAGSGPSKPAEYLQPGHVAAEVTDDIARFVKSLR